MLGNKNNQKRRVYNYLQEHGTITDQQARDTFGITRLADVVYKLKKLGIRINTELIDEKNRFGEECRIARYKFADGEAVQMELT